MGTAKPTISDRIKGSLKRIEPWQGILAVIVTCVGSLYGAHAWVRSVAQNAVMDERFLASFAGRVRPLCIFNSRGSIETDLGANDYIETIRVIPIPEAFGFRILIQGKCHLAYPPLVNGLDVSLFPEAVTRGNLHDWDIILAPQTTTVNFIQEGLMDTNRVYRFKLEILH